MKKISILALTLFWAAGIFAQQNVKPNLGGKSKNELFQKDWSNFDHLVAGDHKMTSKDIFRFPFDLKKNYADLPSNNQFKVGKPRSQPSSMPIVVPKGIHPMKVYGIGDRSLFYLDIYRPD